MELIATSKRLCLEFVTNGRGAAAILAIVLILTAGGMTAGASSKPHTAAAVKTHAATAKHQHADDQPSGQPVDDAQRFSISGTVVAVHYDANSVTISAGDKRAEIVITPTTVIEYRHEVGSIADIHKGRKLSASGVIRGGTMVALNIVLR